MAKVYSVSKDGSAFTWAFAQAEAAADGGTAELAFDRETATSGRWKLEAKNYFRQDHAKVISASFFAATSLLVCGFSSGIFALYEMPDFTNIHSLSISQQKVDTVAINASGDWLAFGSAKLGQLLVWEWQSETYVLSAGTRVRHERDRVLTGG